MFWNTGGPGMKKGISQNQLKWIAIITMTIDHAGMVLFPHLLWMRLIGRLAFPIYCYLLVKGFVHTSSRLKYLTRLLVFAAVSELPFDLACFGAFSWRGQNVFFMLAICLCMLWLMEKGVQRIKHKELLQALGVAVILGMTAIITLICRFDYGFSGPFLVAALYLGERQRSRYGNRNGLFGPCESILLFLFAMFTGRLLEGYSVRIACNSVVNEAFCLPAGLLMQRCSGKRKKKGGKYFFYLYYPLHLLILYGIQLAVRG